MNDTIFFNITSTDAIYEYVNGSRTSGRNSHEYQRNRIVNLHIATVNVQLTRDTCMLQVTWQLTFIVFLQYLEVLRRNLRRELQGGSTTQLCARESNGTTSFPLEQLKQKKTSELININVKIIYQPIRRLIEVCILGMHYFLETVSI